MNEDNYGNTIPHTNNDGDEIPVYSESSENGYPPGWEYGRPPSAGYIAEQVAAPPPQRQSRPYRPIAIPNYGPALDRYSQMARNSVPSARPANLDMIRRGGQGQRFASDRGPMRGGLTGPRPPSGERSRPPRGMIGQLGGLRPSRPMPPNRGYNGSGAGNYGRPNPPPGNITIPRGEFNPGGTSDPRLSMSLEPDAGYAGGMVGPRPLMVR